MKKKEYEVPLTTYSEVEVEGNFCGSVYETEENTESLSIENHEVDTDHIYNFGDETEWK